MLNVSEYDYMLMFLCLSDNLNVCVSSIVVYKESSCIHLDGLIFMKDVEMWCTC